MFYVRGGRRCTCDGYGCVDPLGFFGAGVGGPHGRKVGRRYEGVPGLSIVVSRRSVFPWGVGGELPFVAEVFGGWTGEGRPGWHGRPVQGRRAAGSFGGRVLRSLFSAGHGAGTGSTGRRPRARCWRDGVPSVYRGEYLLHYPVVYPVMPVCNYAVAGCSNGGDCSP